MEAPRPEDRSGESLTIPTLSVSLDIRSQAPETRRSPVKDDLYMLRPGFQKNAEGSYYCGDAVAIEGLLSFFPELRDLVSVHHIAGHRQLRAIQF